MTGDTVALWLHTFTEGGALLLQHQVVCDTETCQHSRPPANLRATEEDFVKDKQVVFEKTRLMFSAFSPSSSWLVRPQIDSQRHLQCGLCKPGHTHLIFFLKWFLSQSHFSFFSYLLCCALCGSLNVGTHDMFALCVCFEYVHTQDCENMSIWWALSTQLSSFSVILSHICVCAC